MRFDLVALNWEMFASGMWMTVQLTLMSLATGFCIALPAGLIRARRIRIILPLINMYVYAFRGTPLLSEAYWCALITFSVNSGAYATEIIRGAVEAVRKAELEAAKALGLSPRKVDILVLIPSALRRALPQYGNEAVFMLHGSVVASMITIQDILGAGRTLNARYYSAYEGFLTAAALYMLITFVLAFAFRLLDRRYLRHLRVSN